MTVIVVFDSFGYWRICRPVIAFSPISRISRLTTSASTGRRMKMSVKDMSKPDIVIPRSGIRPAVSRGPACEGDGVGSFQFGQVAGGCGGELLIATCAPFWTLT